MANRTRTHGTPAARERARHCPRQDICGDQDIHLRLHVHQDFCIHPDARIDR